MIRRLQPYGQPARAEMVAGLLLAVFGVGLELLQPWPLKWLVDYVLGGQSPPLWLAHQLPALAGGDRGRAALSVCLALIGLAVGHRFLNVGSSLLLIRAGEKVVFALRCRAFDQLQRLSLAYHDRTKVGESLYRVAYDAHAAQSLLNGAAVPLITGGCLFVGVLIVLLRLDVALTLLTLGTAPLFLALIRYFGGRIDRSSKAYHEQESALVSAAQESLSSIRAVQAFTMEAQSAWRFQRLARQSLAQHLTLIRNQLQFSGWVGLVMAVGTAAVAYVGARRVLAGGLMVGDILVFLAYLGMLYQPVNAFCQSAGVVRSASVQLRRVFEVIDSVPAIRDRPSAGILYPVRGQVEYRDVSFAYEGGSPVLRGISLGVAPGTVVALVGRSGAGKTTLASLLTRFYDPDQGAVLLDGVDLRDLKLDWLRRQVSVVMQDPILFSGTIRENIAVGCPNASEADLLQAARRAQLHDDILKLPAGYDTLLGERGVNLSGGQRQRLSIARALLKDAPLLILDEPTAALDVHTESRLLAALRELVRGRTTLIIAHRLSTVRLADRIVVLEDGRIVEQGTHEQLLRTGGTYAAMVREHLPEGARFDEAFLELQA